MAKTVTKSFSFSAAILLLCLSFESLRVCDALNLNNMPIFIESIYQMIGEKCVIQEAAFSTANSTRVLQERLDEPFNNTVIALPPGTVSNDDPNAPQNGNSFSSAFSYTQNCTEEVCTLVLTLHKSRCGNTDLPPGGFYYYVKTTNVQATGISSIKIFSDRDELVTELKEDNLANSAKYNYPNKYNTNIVVFKYNVSDPLNFEYDFIVDACCIVQRSN